MNIQIEKVNIEQKHILKNLLEFYIYEFSTFLDIDFKENGLFGYDPLDRFFSESNYFPYFIKFEDKLVGFVVVKKEETSASNQETSHCSIHEFFIAKKFMGKGIGRAAAKEVFDRYPGKWTVTQIENNYPAQAFWRSTIKKYTQGNYTEYYDQNRRPVQEFDHAQLPK